VAAKGALLGLTKAWAREFAPHGITVNAVAPGLIATPLTRGSIGENALAERGRAVPLGRLAEPREIAYAVAWLAGPEAAMMTGQVVSPNGGASIVGI
jgi:3-oxoacyl-[acyl-carrier protein] reductase